MLVVFPVFFSVLCLSPRFHFERKYLKIEFSYIFLFPCVHGRLVCNPLTIPRPFRFHSHSNHQFYFAFFLLVLFVVWGKRSAVESKGEMNPSSNNAHIKHWTGRKTEAGKFCDTEICYVSNFILFFISVNPPTSTSDWYVPHFFFFFQSSQGK